ncbi:hypothetical protein ACS0TY_020735 [Phlomoides rotata]
MDSPQFWVNVIYFGEFINENGQWEWKRSEGDHGANVEGLPISSNMTYEELHSEVLSLCKVDSSLHDVEMRFLLPGKKEFQVPIQIISNRHLHWLVGLNKQGHYCSICVTIVDKITSAGQQEDDDYNFEMQVNEAHETDQGVDWNTLEVVSNINADISTHNAAFTTPRCEFVHDNREENHIACEYIASSSNSRTLQVVPSGLDLQQG